MKITLNSGLENAMVNYLTASVNGLNASNVHRYIGVTTADTPCAFVISGKGTEKVINSGIFDVPLSVKVVMLAEDEKMSPGLTDTLTAAVETAITGSQNVINSNSGDIFIFSLRKPYNAYLDVVDNTYQYSLDLEATCKMR